jgi:hypothetical protein
MLKKTIYIGLILFTTQLWSISCDDFRTQTLISSDWMHLGRRLIQCNNAGLTADETFIARFHDICKAINDDTGTGKYISQRLKDSASSMQNETYIPNIKSSNLYNFLQQPYYNILLNKFDMRTNREGVLITGEYLGNNDEWLCAKKDNFSVINSNGQTFYYNFGNSDWCEEYSDFFPVFVGWAERNLSNHPDLVDNQSSFADIISKGAFNLNDAQINALRYLVDDHSCPALPNGVYEGCRVCDQFYAGYQRQLCKIGYFWRFPLAWQGNGCATDGQCLSGGNLLQVLYRWMHDSSDFYKGGGGDDASRTPSTDYFLGCGAKTIWGCDSDGIQTWARSSDFGNTLAANIWRTMGISF